MVFENTLADQQAALDTWESERLGATAESALIMLNEMEQLSYR